MAVVVDFKIEKETLGPDLGHRIRIGMNSTKIFTLLTITMKMIIIMIIMKVMKDAPQEVKSGYKAPDLWLGCFIKRDFRLSMGHKGWGTVWTSLVTPRLGTAGPKSTLTYTPENLPNSNTKTSKVKWLSNKLNKILNINHPRNC